MNDKTKKVTKFPTTTTERDIPSKGEFLSKAKSVALHDASGKHVGDLDAREFSSGSYGWYGNFKGLVKLGDGDVRCQFSVNAVVIGSKPAA